MSFGFSISDIFACARSAWDIYNQLRNSPIEIQAISDDVGLLHMTLRSMNENVISSAPLASHDVEGIALTMERCRNVLAELQPLADKYGNTRFTLKSRVKFQLEDVKNIRQRLRMALDGLNSFNQAVSLSISLKMDASQEAILKTLNRIRADVQSGKRERSSISQLAQDPEKADEQNILMEILKELEAEGISKQELRDNKAVVTQWIMRGVREGEWQELPPETPPNYFTIPVRALDDTQIKLAHRCKIEVLSATYGPMDVTSKMRQFLMTNVFPGAKRVLNVTDDFFAFSGRDPAPGTKLLVLVCRKRVSWDDRSRHRYSEPVTFVISENHQYIFHYEWDCPPVDSESYSGSSLNILSALFHSQDVTSMVARFIRDPIRVSNAVFGDPQVGVRKILTVTYCYGVPDNIADIHVKTYHEETDMYIPPPLKIAAASFATTDITDSLRAQVTPDQRLVLNLNYRLCDQDPLFGAVKTLAIMFQYGDEPLQLLVRWEGNEVLKIEPHGPQQKNFLNPMPPRFDDPVHILGAVWGVQPVFLRHFGLMQQRQEFPCTNEWFGFDGRPNVKKTCQLFIQDLRSGTIRCVAALEGETLKIDGKKWEQAQPPNYSDLPSNEQSSTRLMDVTLSEVETK